jgi:hypothetical protein
MRTLLTRAAKSAVLNNTATSFMLVLELESGSDEEVEVVISTKDEAECESCPISVRIGDILSGWGTSKRAEMRNIYASIYTTLEGMKDSWTIVLLLCGMRFAVLKADNCSTLVARYWNRQLR